METIYSPFVQKNITTTYANANKYTAAGALDAQQKFANDLTQLKTKQGKDKKIPQKKDEFPVEIEKELEQKLTFIQKETSFAKKTATITQAGKSLYIEVKALKLKINYSSRRSETQGKNKPRRRRRRVRIGGRRGRGGRHHRRRGGRSN